MKTKYTKVAVSDELPNIGVDVICIKADQMTEVMFLMGNGSFWSYTDNIISSQKLPIGSKKYPTTKPSWWILSKQLTLI